MKSYLNYVITIINKEGIEENLPSDMTDAKHISAYKRLIKQIGYDKYNINKYIDNIQSQGQITGFDISKYISGQGNIVFFHTDVHNSQDNNKTASLMVPYNISFAQSKKLADLMINLEEDGFNYYIGCTKLSKSGKKTTYQLIKKIEPEIKNQRDGGFQYVK